MSGREAANWLKRAVMVKLMTIRTILTQVGARGSILGAAEYISTSIIS
jgi:hypothetical protein